MADFPTAAVNRLAGYNGARYDATTNPLGMAIGGHRVNFPASLNDSASVTAYIAATSQEVKDAAAAVAANLTATNSARDLAQKWASAPENQVVSGGLFSGRHYAARAAASAQQAATFDPALFHKKADNLAGVADAAAARQNLGAVSRAGDAGMSGRFVTSGTFEGTLVHNAGYLDIQSFSTGTYGSGLARFWYNPGTRTIAAGPVGDGSGRLSLTGIDIDVSQAIGAVPDTRSITAGNGLTGGGSLAANRTVTLGAPGTLTASTANAVQTAGHTHNVDAASIASVGNSLLGTGTLGTPALMRHINNAQVNAGLSAAGASLRYANVAGGSEGSIPTGTWRAMGFSAGGDAASSTTLYVRIA